MAPAFYLEAQIDSSCGKIIGDVNHELQKVFSDGLIEHLMLNLDLCASDIYGNCFPGYVTSIKAVYYTESNDVTAYHDTKDCRIVINSYKMRDDDDDKEALDEDLSSTHPRLLPSSSLEDTWERLIFDCDIKESLVQLATNSLRFKTLNRLVLLTGPPGTGKTTLAQALAQRLSIRLNNTFDFTYLLHLRAAALLSQFFGQSAKQIHKIFESIAGLSQANPTTLYVLVIDEIESLAGSRSRANAQGEVQDAVRATNELLVGFDTIKNKNNVLIISTSNLLDSLDEAFTDRCSEKIVVPPPGAEAKYEILRYGLGMLVTEEIITIGENDALPKYDDAVAELEEEYGTTGARLRLLVDSFTQQGGSPVSARWLGQLPELALGKYLDPDATCSLSDAVDLMKRYIEGQNLVKRHSRTANENTDATKTGQSSKRKLTLDEDPTSSGHASPKRARFETDNQIHALARQAIKDEVEKQLATIRDTLNQELSELMDKKFRDFFDNQQQVNGQAQVHITEDLPIRANVDMAYPPQTVNNAANDTMSSQKSPIRDEKNVRKPLHAIAQVSDEMLLGGDESAPMQRKKQRHGSLIDRLDTVLGGVMKENGAQ